MVQRRELPETLTGEDYKEVYPFMPAI